MHKGFALGLILLIASAGYAQQSRHLSGVTVTSEFELVPRVAIEVRHSDGTMTMTSDDEGRFNIAVPPGPFSVTFSGKYLATTEKKFSAADRTTSLQVKIAYVVPPVAETVRIEADALTPQIEFRNNTIYENTLFSRDDQLVQTLNGGINAGQHEGGGKSLEVRRYGFNLDHGGVSGGLKILVDNVQQNQGTQGHGQGYLGALKFLTPELVDEISLINGPFSAEYGDFSGLGVVQIRQKESLLSVFTARLQAGAFNTYRGFFAYSPKLKGIDAFVAYEPAYTDGPFDNPLRYRRDNFTSNLTYKIDDHKAVGLKLRLGRNDFTSSGQIPLDLVASGALDRFGFIDPENGGKAQSGTAEIAFRNEAESGSTLKIDGFVSRSLLDLFSNFTFFAADPIYGEEIQQHDSRLQQGANVQYVRPYKLFGRLGFVTAGANFHASQINVGLYPTVARNPDRKFRPENVANPNVLLTSAQANVYNVAGYVQNEISFFKGSLRLQTGLRFDNFTFDVNGFELSDERTDLSGRESAGKFQPKASIAWSPLETFPITIYANYGRGISSQDARGIVREPAGSKISTTDFYQAGTSYNGGRVSILLSTYLIDRSREQVYIPDDGSIELLGRSRSYGVEGRTSLKVTKHFSFQGGFTKVLRAYYPGQFTEDGRRVTVDGAPSLTANAGVALTELRGFNASLTWRHISRYRLEAESGIDASGNDVVDIALSKRLRRWVDLNFSIDNLLNKQYYETQNYFESRVCGSCDLRPRIHATPGYPMTVTAGLTFRLARKD